MRIATRTTFMIGMLATSLAACGGARPITAATSSPVTGSRFASTRTGEEMAFGALVDSLAKADVVFFGEQHDDAEAHRLQARTLGAIAATGRPVILSLEMFERDVQPALAGYLGGEITEADLLAGARPWPRYATDYRPMVELAKANHWTVVAANVPRSIASSVGRRGLAALDSLAPAERQFAAAEISCPADDYRTRFLQEMRGHSPRGASAQPGDTLPTAAAERFYLAQCVKDETMAEAIVRARQRDPRALVLHVNGAFHSDFGQGTAARVRRREPTWKVAILTAVPVSDPSIAAASAHRGRADYVIFTARPR